MDLEAAEPATGDRGSGRLRCPCPGRSRSSRWGPRDGLQNEAARDPDRRQARLHRPARRGRPARDRGDVVRPPARGPAARRRGRAVPVDRPRGPASGTRCSCPRCAASSARSPRAPTRSRWSSARPTRSIGRTSTGPSRRRSPTRPASSADAAGPVDARPRLRVGRVRLPVRGRGGPGDDRRRGGPARSTSAATRSASATRSGRRPPATSRASSTPCSRWSTSGASGSTPTTRAARRSPTSTRRSSVASPSIDSSAGGLGGLPVRRAGRGRQPRDRGPRLPARRAADRARASASTA